MKSINLLFPHQLFEQNPLLESKTIPVYIIEEFLFFQQYTFHQAKLIFHRASMMAYADTLRQLGYTVHYIESHSPQADIRKAIEFFHQENIDTIYTIDPVDDWLSRRLSTACEKFSINLHTIESPLFLNSSKDLLNNFFAPHKKTYFQTTFYKQQRIAHHILVDDDNQPIGGQWTYDVDNRKKYPKGQAVVKTHFPSTTSYWEEATQYVSTHFPNALGQTTWVYPHTSEQSKAWLKQFLVQRFHDFGIYEDAMVSGESILHHSVLTPMLNVGLITPQYIVQETLQYAQQHSIPLNSLEGFIRQIIGWREFIRG
ncbi:MAG: cryptochrome/photolyase family protein, partial [Chitinophagaceae bacterium]